MFLERILIQVLTDVRWEDLNANDVDGIFIYVSLK